MPREYIWRAKVSFSENLKRLRRDQGLNQGDLAKLCKVNESLIPKLEKEGSNPKLETIYALMEGLKCSADTLLLDGKKMGIGALLAASFERADKLPDEEKMILIDLIDKYCIANGMGKLLEKNAKTLFGFMRSTGGIDKQIDEIKK